MHKSQVFFYFLLSFLAGTLLDYFLFIHQFIWLAGLILGLVGIALFWRRKWSYVFFAFLLIFLVVGGVRAQTFRLNHGVLNEFADKNFTVNLRGYIDGEVENLGNRQRFVFRIKELRLPDAETEINEKILITTQSYPIFYYGETLEVKGKIKLPENFDDFDYRTFLAKDQIFTVMGFPKIQKGELSLNKSESLKILIFENIFRLKSKFQASIQKSVSEPNAAFISGILLGSRGNIPQDLKDNFAKTGTTHILAISGYNITVLAVVVSWFFLLFLNRKTAFWLSVFAILIFTILTGASASVSRAAVMGALVLTAQNSGRLYDSKNAMILAAATMVWHNPMSLRFDIGFQLSFLATAGILFVAPIFEKYFEKFPNLWKLKETFIGTLSAQLMVLPLILFYFHNFSLVALPVNLAILPFIPYAMLLGFLSGIGGIMWGWLGFVFGLFAWLVTSFEILVINLFAAIPYASLGVFIPWHAVLIFYTVLVLALFKLKRKTASNLKKIND